MWCCTSRRGIIAHAFRVMLTSWGLYLCNRVLQTRTSVGRGTRCARGNIARSPTLSLFGSMFGSISVCVVISTLSQRHHVKMATFRKQHESCNRQRKYICGQLASIAKASRPLLYLSYLNTFSVCLVVSVFSLVSYGLTARADKSQTKTKPPGKHSCT